MMTDDASRQCNATPGALCEAARAGDIDAIDAILREDPALIGVDNPHNWTQTVSGHAIRGTYNKKPVEVAAFFNRPSAVARLLELAETSPSLNNPLGGYFQSLRIAKTLGHAEVIQVIEADIIRRIDKRPELVHHADEAGNTLLHQVARFCHLPMIEVLLARGARADPVNCSGARPIHWVLDDGDDPAYVRAAKLLIDHGADYDLWIAAALDDLSRAKELLSSESSLASQHYRPDCDQLTEGYPLVRACARGNRQMVELLLAHGADVNAARPVEDAPEFGMPLIAAVYASHFDIAHLLLDHGASVDAHPNCAAPLPDMLYAAAMGANSGWLALGELHHATQDPTRAHQASLGESTEVVRLFERVLLLGGRPSLLSHVKQRNYVLIAELLHQCPKGKGTPADWMSDNVFESFTDAASWLGEARVMDLCLQIRPQLQTPRRAIACIEQAIRSHNRDGDFASYRRIIEMNLLRGADQNAGLDLAGLDLDHLTWEDQNRLGTPLHWLSTRFLENYSYGTCPDLPTMDNLLDLAELFIEYGADINARHPVTNLTPLAAAAIEGHIEYVERLLRHGADNCLDDPPKTNPLVQARRKGFTEIVKLLESP